MSNWGIGCPGGTPVLTGQGCLKYLIGVKIVDFVSLRVFSLTSSTAEKFAVPLRDSEPKKK